jgi:hypothetical protein
MFNLICGLLKITLYENIHTSFFYRFDGIKRVATTSAPAVPVNVQAQTVAAPVATPISGLLYIID